MSAYDVIDCSQEHAEEVRELIREVLCGEFDSPADPTNADDLRDIEASYTPPGNRFLIAMVDGEVVATSAVLGLSDRECELKWLFVRQGYRREGLASTLVGKLLPFAVEFGYKRIMLEIRPEMLPYTKVYRRYGFAELSPDESPGGGNPYMAIDL